jgi:hypothetical protein
LRIGVKGLHACSIDFQVKECFQNKGPESCFANSAQDTFTDLEDQIKDLEDVVRQRVGARREIEIRLLPNDLEMRLCHKSNLANK